MITSVDKEIKKIYYKGSKKSLFVNILLVSLIAVISGCTIGMWILGRDKGTDLYNIDTNNLYDNVVLIKEESLSKTPIELGAKKCAALAIYTTNNEPSVQMVGEGKVVSMGVTQKIKTKTVKQNGKIFYENVSVSNLVSATNRFYLENNVITRIKGSVKGNTVNWNGGSSTMTVEQYKETMGVDIAEYMCYIISSKTITSNSEVALNDEGNYEFTFTLDKVSSVINYVKNMKETGGLGDYPKFNEDISVKIVMDSNYRILTFSCTENYKVKKGIWVNAVGDLVNTFTYDQNFAIPNKSEPTTM